MLVPADLKYEAARKYYDWAARDMNELHRCGVDGVRVILYGSTLDSPGRRELLCMQSVTAFYPCPHCIHTWQPGMLSMIYGGYRCFLPLHHPWRKKEFTFMGLKYMFRDVETRPTPLRRTDANVQVMVSLASKSQPFCGHKSRPFLSRWIGADWDGSFCDIMHDMKCFAERLLKGLVGRGSEGMYQGWKYDAEHRAECAAFSIFEEFASGQSRPPWRLSREEILLMDMRVRTMWWPHHKDVLQWKRHSFWTHSDRIWKAVHKLYVLLVILPTCLRGVVAAVHTVILVTVDALRQLSHGQVLCVAEAIRLGVNPGEHVCDKSLLPRLRDQLIRGMVLLDGSFCVGRINPAAHHFVHYPWQV